MVDAIGLRRPHDRVGGSEVGDLDAVYITSGLEGDVPVDHISEDPGDVAFHWVTVAASTG